MEHRQEMDDYLTTLSADEHEIFSTIARYAFSLGYKAKRDKTRQLSLTFTHPKIKQRVLRFSTSQGKPLIKLRFFAAQQYSLYFQEAVRAVIEEYEYRYTGCYGCGSCDGTQGYRYIYPDGREFFRCGSELIELFDLKNLPLPELLDLFRQQHEYYLRQQPSVT